MNRTFKSKLTTAATLKVTVRLLFVLAAFFFTRAEAYASHANASHESAPVRICFPSDRFAVNPAYLDNAQSLERVDSLARICADNPEASLEITAYSSPEGNVLYNQYLSENRAASLRHYVIAKYPGLRGRIAVLPYAEGWADLRASVTRDARLDAYTRAQVLEVIDSDRDSDEKEEMLKALPAYHHLYRNFFRSIRYAEISLSGARKAIAIAHAGASDTRCKILFPESTVALDSTFAGNPPVLKAIDELLTGENAAQITTLNIVSGSSPDGPVAGNRHIAALRGEALRRYVEEKYPAFSDRVVLQPQGEAWDELRDIVQGTSRLDAEQKAEILAVIDNPVLGPDARETGLRSLATWHTVRRELLPQTRFAALVPVWTDTTATPTPAPAPALLDTLARAHDIIVPDAHARDAKTVDTVAVAAPADTVVPTPVTLVADTLAAAPADTAAPALTDVKVYENFTRIRKPLFAVSTNLLYESATVFTGFHSVPLNVGVEVPIGAHFSVFANYMATAPWRAWNNNADCFELLHADLGARWYPGGTFSNPFKHNPDRQLLDGWYAYASLGSGYYDFERGGRGYQGEEYLGSFGLGYGLNLGSNWSLDFAAGGGPVFTRYRYYIEVDRSNSEHLVYQYSGKLTYFGITDAKVSLRYLIHYNKKVKVQ